MGSNDTFKIFIGNLAPTVKDSDLHEVFNRHGTIVEAVVMTGKNYGFVHMTSESQGLKAMQKLEGFVLHGQRMSVQRATAKKEPSMKKTVAVVGQGISHIDNFDDHKKANYNLSQTPEGSNNQDPSYQVANSKKASSVKQLNIIGQNIGNIDGFDRSAEVPNENGNNQMELKKANLLPSSDQSYNPSNSSTSSERPSPLLINHTPQSYTPDILYRENDIDNFNHIITTQENDFKCSICDEKYDNLIHVPKILSCDHTFCLDCLRSIAKGAEIKCRRGCPYVTILSESGVTGLTTNQTKIPLRVSDYMQASFDDHRQPQSFVENEVCVVCLCSPLTPVCLVQKHEVMRESKAFELLRPKLKSLINESFTTLRRVMTIKANLKERMQYTLHSLNKFSEELKMKIEGEDFEQELHQNSLQDLNECDVSLLNTTSISDMLTMCRQVDTFSHQINNQHTVCYAKNAINGALDSILLRLNDSALESCLSHLGFSKEEAFSLSSSLRENADKGNFANVLLIYLLCDLLSFRYRPSVRGPPMPLISSAHSFGNTQQMVPREQLPPQINRDMFDIDKMLETTEAIESTRQELPPVTTINGREEHTSPPIVSSALALGLSNISLLPLEKTPEKEVEPSLVSYVSAAKKPAKPIPKHTIVATIRTTEPSPPNKTATKFPHCWMTVSINGNNAGRIVFQLRPDMAPRMCDNFIGLCTGRSGYGYKGTHFFKSGDGFLVGGDVEHDDGSGGYSVYNRSKFEADLCPLKDDVGMVRFKGIGTSENGRGMVGSQFMIWYTERDFKKFSFSLVFGRVVDGIKIVQEIANHNLHNVAIKVEECGAI